MKTIPKCGTLRMTDFENLYCFLNFGVGKYFPGQYVGKRGMRHAADLTGVAGALLDARPGNDRLQLGKMADAIFLCSVSNAAILEIAARCGSDCRARLRSR